MALITSTTTEPPPSDWDLADALLQKYPSRWGSLSWISAKALLDSVNHGLDRFSDGLVPQLRRDWVARTPAPPLRIVDRPDVTTFFVIGDTGEQDASQYVVCPSLSAAVREHRPGFVLMASDVIYPAGDVDDYRDAVYRPYRGTDPQFRVDAPLLGLPGNHDWYDGLAGFMYHFADQDKPPAAAYAPQRSGFLSRLSRILWRRPLDARDTGLRGEVPRRGPHPLTGSMTQPGPYYAVRTKHLLLVAIDTGIDGTIDEDQYAWLCEVSELREPKILVTGKPLLVNGRREEGWVGRRPKHRDQDTAPSVWKVVQDPAHRYLATVGGDVHNFQRYRPKQEDEAGPVLHLVSGGGGAFVHGTHSYVNADRDSLVRHHPDKPFYALPDVSFPSRNESFRHFAGLLVPAILRMMGNLALFAAGVLAGSLGVGLSAGAGLVYSAVAAGGGLVLLALLVVVRTKLRKASRTSTLARYSVSVGSFAIGLLTASAAYRLDPAHYVVYLLAWVGFTGFHCFAGFLVRTSRWWRPADESSVNPSWWAFGGATTLLSALAYLLLSGTAYRLLDGDLVPRSAVPFFSPWALGGTALIFVVAWFGFWARQRRLTGEGVGALDDNTKKAYGRRNCWRRVGAILVPAIQAIVIGIGLALVARIAGPPWLFAAAGLGVVLTAVAAGLVAVLLVLVTELVARWRSRREAGPAAYAKAWGVASGATHFLPIPLLLASVAVLALIFGSPNWQPVVGLPLVAFSVGSYVVFAVWLRRRVGRKYLWVAIGLPVVLLMLGLVLRPWWAQAGVATAVVLVALGSSLVAGHLFFLGAPGLIVARDGLAAPRFTDEDLDEIYAARRQRPPQQPKVAANVRRWARLTAPDLGEPGGPLQQKVAEIFSSDRPPFHKSFLRLETDDTELRITLHQAFGEEPASTLPVGAIRLDREEQRLT